MVSCLHGLLALDLTQVRKYNALVQEVNSRSAKGSWKDFLKRAEKTKISSSI